MLSLIIFTLVSYANPQPPVWLSQWPDTSVIKWINRGLENAPDVKIAEARVQQARAQELQTRQAFLPSLSASWSSNTQPRDALGFGFGLSSMSDMFGAIPNSPEEETDDEDSVELFTSGTAAIRADLPLDVFGKGIAQNKAARLSAAASSQDEKNIRIALSLQIAGAYYDVLNAKAQLTIVEDQLVSNRKLLELTMLRQQRGEASALDVLQQEQQLAALEGQRPRAETLIRIQMLRLKTLCGGKTEFSDPTGELPTLAPISEHERKVFIVQRPDVIAARHRLDAAKKQKWAATADFLPEFSVGGQLSRQANYADEEWDTLDTWGFNTGARMTLIQGGKSAAHQQASAAVVIAQEQLRQIELQANQQLDQALENERLGVATIVATEKQLVAAQRASKAAEQQYQQGLTNFITLLSTQQAFLSSQQALLQAHRDQIAARLQTIQTLGGQGTEVSK